MSSNSSTVLKHSGPSKKETSRSKKEPSSVDIPKNAKIGKSIFMNIVDQNLLML